MTVGLQYAGEFDIDEALLVSPTGGVMDLIKDVIIVELNIFEDMFKSSISGSIIIVDSNNVISKIPVVGQEYLTLKIRTPSLTLDRDIIDFTDNPFAIYKVGFRKEVTSGGQTYELKFVSQEAIKNSQRKISKSYNDRKANIGAIVFDLLAEDENSIRTSKKVFIEPTLGSRPYVIPNINPFHAITKLTNEAVSKVETLTNNKPTKKIIFQ